MPSGSRSAAKGWQKAPGPARGLGARTRRAAKARVKLAVVYTERQIRQQVRRIALEMNRDYKGKTLHLVGILENSFVFVADLVRELKVPVVCYFLKAVVRDGWLEGSPLREIAYGPTPEVEGKDVVLVDGILPTGVTFDYLRRQILAQKPRSLRIAALVEKLDAKRVDLYADYVGFHTVGKYVVGYGLGRGGDYRHLPWISALA